MPQGTPFTHTQQVVLDRMRKALDRQSPRAISVDYGSTEDRLIFHATLCAEESTGRPKEPLVSVLTGPAIGGDGYAVRAADGATLANRVSFVLAAEVAKAAAWRVRDIGLSGLTFECSPLGEIQLRRKPLPRNNKA